MSLLHLRGLGLALLAGSALVLSACSTPEGQSPSVVPIDSSASERTRALLHNLYEVRERGFLFGHQDSLAYGVEWWDEPGRSDVQSVTGDYPALYGWDLGHIERGAEANLDDVNFASMQGWIQDGYSRGGVITLSWHTTHPATGYSAWDTDRGAESLLPGGEHHDELVEALDRLAGFIDGLTATDDRGNTYPIPLIFRPWHEHNGDWFWWGRGPTSEQDFIELWRFTVEYLRDEKALNHLLYAFSPDRSRIDMASFREDLLYGYPGDDYVDILGIDNYWDLGHPSNEASAEEDARHFAESLSALAQLAAEKGKLAAMTEGGQDTLPEEDFWTARILPGLMADEWTQQIAYIQVWRNANRAKENRDHFYAPYVGHPGEADFVEFYDHPATFFENDLPDMYRR